VLLSVQTADCVPILLADTKWRAIAAVHAGWRGTLSRIVVKTLGRMRQEFGTRPQDVVAAIGPSIGGCCYEVGPEVAKDFASQFGAASEWFDERFAPQAEGELQTWLPWLTMMPPGHQPEPERARLDLREANRWQLVDAGVSPKRIAVSGLCTKCRADLFFSYRRDGAGTGRLMAVIGMKPSPVKR
jgi:YfiH family protein